MSGRHEIEASEITEMVYELSLKANRILPEGIKKIIRDARDREKMPLAKQAFSDILENADLAEEKRMPICQDCGLAVVFVDVGQDLCVKGGSIEDAINEGIRRAYTEGYLRKSVVKDPLFRRENSGDNTPAVIHWKVCTGGDIRLTVSPKGMGSENMSRIYMLKPADGAEGVIKSVVETVKIAGPNPCPPIVLGIGIGGNFETVALAAKRALLKPEGVRHNIPEYADMEREILVRVNALGIGPGGYGGVTTALDAHIETLPTHIAGMPLAVNICCHALRHAEGTIEGRLSNG
ncbi:MAG TPA: fumarate hydratase [Synergistaceae bacterium]|nr:fumarate hydratase [Synergistaceae bacterium]